MYLTEDRLDYERFQLDFFIFFFLFLFQHSLLLLKKSIEDCGRIR
jgi:hypothetical protein